MHLLNHRKNNLLKFKVFLNVYIGFSLTFRLERLLRLGGWKLQIWSLPISLAPPSSFLSITQLPRTLFKCCPFREHIVQSKVTLSASLFTNNYNPLPLSFLFGYIISSYIILIDALEIFDIKAFYGEIKKIYRKAKSNQNNSFSIWSMKQTVVKELAW